MLKTLMLGIMLTTSEGGDSSLLTPLPSDANRDALLSPSARPFAAPAFLVPERRPAQARPPRAIAAARIETDPKLDCTIIVLKADPRIDSAMARDADPAIDPGIARPSACRK